jgi:hypothetical protein
MLESYDNEVKGLKRELFRVCWFMRGGLSYGEALELSYKERGIINQIIESNLETSKKTGRDFF